MFELWCTESHHFRSGFAHEHHVGLRKGRKVA